MRCSHLDMLQVGLQSASTMDLSTTKPRYTRYKPGETINPAVLSWLTRGQDIMFFLFFFGVHVFWFVFFRANTCTQLKFGAKICHVRCSSICFHCFSRFLSWCSLIYPRFSLFVFHTCSLNFPWFHVFAWFQSIFPCIICTW